MPLNDKTRRRICLTLFGMLCVAPTLSVLAWGAWLMRPGYVEAYRQQLAAQVGGGVQLENVSFPLPGVTLLEGFELQDPETGETLLKTRLVEVSRHDGTCRISIEQPEIAAGALERLRDRLDAVLRGRRPQDEPITFTAGELTLHSGDVSQTFTHVSGWLESLAGPKPTPPDVALQGARAGAKFRLAGAENPEPAEIEILRTRDPGPPATQVALRTGPTPLPLAVLSLDGSLARRLTARLGSDCQFEGTIAWTHAGDGWQCEVRGDSSEAPARLTGIDMYRVFNNHFPHRLSGPAQLSLTRAVIREGRLEEAEGRLDASGGEVSGSLLLSLSESLEMPLSIKPLLPDQLFQFQQLALAFRLADGEIALRGMCGETGPAVFATYHGTLLDEPSGVRSVLGLVRALVPQRDVLIPASRESEWLLHRLPIPRIPR